MAVSTSSRFVAPVLGRRGGDAGRRLVAILGPVFAVGIGQFLGPYVISCCSSDPDRPGSPGRTVGPGRPGYLASQILGTVIGWRIVLWATWTMEVKGMALLFQQVFDHLTEQSVAFHSTVSAVPGVADEQVARRVRGLQDTIVWALMPILTGIVVASVVLAFVIWPYALFLFVMSVVFILWCSCVAAHAGSDRSGGEGGEPDDRLPRRRDDQHRRGEGPGLRAGREGDRQRGRGDPHIP